MWKTWIASLSLLVGLAGASSAQTIVASDVTTDTTWGIAPNPCPIILQGVTFVKNNATLTILSGCVVRGQPRQGAVTSPALAPGALVVTRTGRLIANASAGNPIILTTAAVDNDQNGIPDDVDVPIGFNDEWVPGDLFLDNAPATQPLAPLNRAGNANVALWGGLVLLGSAPTNLDDGCGVGKGRCTIEGLVIPGFDPNDATYGGLFPHDSSGSLRFVSIRHAGDELATAGNELNCVSLGGVGDGTVFENIECYTNFDDGFEWFGGTVNGRRLVAAFIGDDMFDLDQGYTGVNQFLFGVAPFFAQNNATTYGSDSGDKAGEFDGDDYRPDPPAAPDNVCILSDDTCRPFSNPNMYNMTIMGTVPDSGAPDFPACGAPGCIATPGVNYSPAPNDNRGIQMRNGFAGEVLNAVVVNTGAGALFDIDSDNGDGCPGSQVNEACTGAGAPFACCTAVDRGTCGNAQCTGAGVPFSCCTGAGAGTCVKFDTIDNVATCSAQVLASTFDDGGTLGTDERNALLCGDADVRSLCDTNSAAGGAANLGCNVCDQAAVFCLPPVAFPGLVNEDTTFNPMGTSTCPGASCGKIVPALKSPAMNPRTAFGTTGTGAAVPGPVVVSYRGAFDPSPAAPLWTNNWTALNKGGLLAN
jgi:hypothetical protein